MPPLLKDPAARRDVRVIGLVSLAHGTSHFFHLLLPPLFPWLMHDFGLSFTEVGALMTIFFVISGTGQAASGFVVDRFGPRRVLFFGVGCLALSGFALGLADSYATLAVSAALAGLGNSVFHPVDFTILNRRVSLQRLGYAFSAHGLSGNLGWAAAPLFMAGIAALAGWHWAGFGAGLLAAGVLALLIWQRDLLEVEERGVHAAQPSRAEQAHSPFAFLQSPGVWLCFSFFFVTTLALGVLQTFSPALLNKVYGLSLAAATSCLTAYMLGGATGILAGGVLASPQRLARPRDHRGAVAVDPVRFDPGSGHRAGLERGCADGGPGLRRGSGRPVARSARAPRGNCRLRQGRVRAGSTASSTPVWTSGSPSHRWCSVR